MIFSFLCSYAGPGSSLQTSTISPRGQGKQSIRRPVEKGSNLGGKQINLEFTHSVMVCNLIMLEIMDAVRNDKNVKILKVKIEWTDNGQNSGQGQLSVT